MITSSASWHYDVTSHLVWPRAAEAPELPFPIAQLKRYLAGLRAIELFRRVSSRANRLVVDSTRGCQLQCDYCYAESGPKHGKIKTDPAALADVRRRYEFDDMSLLGGDPLYDWEHTKACLRAVGPLRKLSVVTNGIGLTLARVHTLQSCCQDLELSISLEPDGWGARMAAGKSQAEILKSKLVYLFQAVPELRPTVLVTLPAEPDVPTTLRELLDTIERMLGTKNFDLSISASSKGLNNAWLNSMLTEEWDAIFEDGYSMHRASSGIIGRYVTSFEHASKVPVTASMAPYTAFTCMPGTAELSVGPDSRLYNCHEHGVLGDDEFHIANESVRGVWPTVQKSVKVRNEGVAACSSCTAYWLCGGLCYAWESSPQCRIANASVPLALQALDVLDPTARVLTNLHLNQVEWLAELALIKAHVLSLIENPDWDALVSGELDAAAMAKILSDLDGKAVDIDAPLWTMTKPTCGAYDHGKLFVDAQ